MAEVRAYTFISIHPHLQLQLSGWQAGDITVDDNHLITICVDLQIVIANVEYRYAETLHFTSSIQLHVQTRTGTSVPSALRRLLYRH